MKLSPAITESLRGLTRWCEQQLGIPVKKLVRRDHYESKLKHEIEWFNACQKVHDLPDIFHYWSNKYLVPKCQPFGYSNPQELFCLYMTRVCREFEQEKSVCRFVSIGSGHCDIETELVQRLLQAGIDNFMLECLDLNEKMLERGKAQAKGKGVADKMLFSVADINSWRPKQTYQIVLAIQALHHFVELETLFDKIYKCLDVRGYFVTDDMIGRNGHLRWPEALAIFNELWAELPEKYKYNHLLRRTEIEYENWDCSTEGFEGIRAQDILPLLLKKFHFESFIAFGNVIDIFVDRCFGHNFDPNSEHDRAFIDRVQVIDELNIESGKIKPTHMQAAMMKTPPARMKTHKHLTPEFCVRWPD